MNRGITSAPMNWAIDYGQNRSGEIMGNAIGNTGNLLGNAIMQFAQDKRKREEKKAKEEAAVRFILASGAGKNIGINDEKTAKQAVTGIGVENVQNLIQIQQRQQQIEQQGEQMKAEADKLAQQNLFLQQKAAKAEQDATAAKQFLGQVAGASPWRNPAAKTQQDVYAAAARTGADPELAVRIAGGMPNPEKAVNPAQFLQDPVTGARFLQSGNSVLPSNAPKGPKPLEAGSEEDITIGGRTVRAVYVGSGNYIDKVTKAPLYVFQEDPSNPYIKIPSPNPILFGVDAARPPTPAGQPAASPTSGGVPVVKTKEEYDKLPVGAAYIDTAGNRAVKQKR